MEALQRKPGKEEPIDSGRREALLFYIAQELAISSSSVLSYLGLVSSFLDSLTVHFLILFSGSVEFCSPRLDPIA